MKLDSNKGEVRANVARKRNRQAAVTVIGLSGLLALAACAGGGGGGAGPASAVIPALTYQYPSSLSTATAADPVGGAIAPYALDPSTPTLVSALPSSLGGTAASGKLTISVSDIPLPSGSPEPAFVVTFNNAAGTVLSNSPLDGIGCVGCLKTTTAPATYASGGGSAGTVTFTYLDPGSASFPLRYSTLGMWTKPTTVSSAGAWTKVGGPFSAGVLTRGIDLPTTGNATYSGYFIGRYVTSDPTAGMPPVGTYLVGANAQAQVNFSGSGAIAFSTSHTHISQELGGGALAPSVLESRLNLSTTTPMKITRTITSNSFTGGPGTLTNTMGMGTTGQIGGSFYGPPASTAPYAPSEMGGALAVGNAGNTQSLVGSFGLKH